MTILKNLLDQALDIGGSLIHEDGRSLADEAASLGRPVTGQSGAAASITSIATGIVTITGLTGMTTASVGRFLVVGNGATPANNGAFLIVEFVSATSVKYANASGVAPDANNPAISWQEREPYSLQDDINFTRTDRANIKGVAHTADIPTYERPTAVGTLVPANLANVASKTTDAKSLVRNLKFEDQAVVATNTFVTLADTGNLPHADAVDRTGIPIHDGADAGNHEATYVEIIDPATESALEVQAVGPQEGWRIFGRTRAGSATEPDEVEVEFRCVEKGEDLSTSVAYTWEAGQPTTVDMFIGKRERLDNLSEVALRTILSSGMSSNADLSQDIKDIRETIDPNFSDGATSLNGLLTNLTNYFTFSDLPDATPSVVEALNTINEQVGNRTYAAPGSTLLNDGDTITNALQDLADAIQASNIVRLIERLAADVNAGTSHLIPGGQSYTLDGSDNGQNLWVYWRGVLRDPGPVVDYNDYEETDTTHITPYTKLKAGDHVNYFILQ